MRFKRLVLVVIYALTVVSLVTVSAQRGKKKGGIVIEPEAPAPAPPRRGGKGAGKSVAPKEKVSFAPKPLPPLVTYEFDVVTVNSKGEITNRRKGQARYFTEDINGVPLEMVEIPGGTFLMGSPSNEIGRAVNEEPQHPVTVPAFYMGKYEVTQAQWRAVARLPRVKRALASNFKGDNLPVELVSWKDAVEFCERLSRATGRQYRLPTEAEWEYACRAGTTTPFHFGETITPDLVNYNGEYPYGAAAKGRYRRQATDVGSLGVANAFGLYDMHGNVWEWCQDNWHDSYRGAPSDGSVWEGGDASFRVLRGGSWRYFADLCRAASRDRSTPDDRNSYNGFRVVLVVRTR